MEPQEVMAEIQFLNKYSGYDYAKERRETWGETVTRVVDYFKEVGGDAVPVEKYQELCDAIFENKVTPSMRLMATAGKGARRNQISIYNCSYLPLQSAFDMHNLAMLLGHGVGVGFSVEKEFVEKWRRLPTALVGTYSFEIPDSIEGWALSFRMLLDNFYNGYRTVFDYSKIRPSGAPLKTRGGHASGPGPLVEAHQKIFAVLEGREGRFLRSIDLLDIACYVADCIVSGGVRRCLPEGSLVHTQGGMKAIESIEVGEMVLTSDGYHSVIRKFEQGEQKLVRVVTQDSSFECTPNHKIAVLSGQDSYVWKMASELMPGDRLIAPSVGVVGSKQELPAFSYTRPPHSATCKDITIPSLDTKMAWLLGLLHGDGHIRLTSKAGEVTLPFANDQVNMAKVAIEQLERFGVNCRVSEYDNYFVVHVKSKQLASYFHSWLKQANTSIEIPDFIWLADENIKLAYISGVMDADGSAKTRPVQVVVTVYEDFAKQIQLLLSSCGIQSRVKALSTSNLEDGWKPKFSVTLVNSISKERVKSIPTLFKNYFGINRLGEKHTNTYPAGFCEYPNKSWTTTDNNLIPVKFIGLEKVDAAAPTWDLEIEGKHEFFCNGYLVHNSAMIAIFDKDDNQMLKAKTGQWWKKNGQRALANISMVIEGRMTQEEWTEYVRMMDSSKAGEPGIWSRHGIKNTLPERRQYVEGYGANPCVEQILRPYQFCNLSQVIARADDTLETLVSKVKMAAFIGTLQSAMTNFKDINEQFAINSEEERLLGVSISGIMDCPLIATGDKKTLNTLRNVVIHENRKWAQRLGINASTSTTCVKPDGNTSVRYDTSPGVHGRYAPFYIRRLQVQADSPIAKWAMWVGIPMEPKAGEDWDNMKTAVLSFPVKSPEGAIIQTGRSAIEQLNSWMRFKLEYTETNPSVTIMYREFEMPEIAKWLYENQDNVVGLSFLPVSDHTYEQMPYEEISESDFNALVQRFPEIDFETFWEWESAVDTTEAASTSGCAGGACLI